MIGELSLLMARTPSSLIFFSSASKMSFPTSKISSVPPSTFCNFMFFFPFLMPSSPPPYIILLDSVWICNWFSRISALLFLTSSCNLEICKPFVLLENDHVDLYQYHISIGPLSFFFWHENIMVRVKTLG